MGFPHAFMDRARVLQTKTGAVDRNTHSSGLARCSERENASKLIAGGPQSRKHWNVDSMRQETAEQQIRELSKKIDFHISEWTIEVLLAKYTKGEVQIPEYQRDFSWEPHRQSRFIESVMMGLPIPFLVFWQNEQGNLEVVDGSQRIRTLAEFRTGNLELINLEGLSELNDFTFDDLLDSRRKKFLNKTVRGIMLNEQTDEAARRDLFDRINTSSKVAEEIEVRRGTLGGPFTKLIDELAQLPLFQRLAPISTQNAKEREREELATRFFAYVDAFGNEFEGYRDRPSDYMFDFVRRKNEELSSAKVDAAALRKSFQSMLEFVEKSFPTGFRKTAKASTTPRARFEAIAVGSSLALATKPSLSSGAETSSWLNEAEFQKILRSDGANNRKTLKGRIAFVRDKLLESS
jgi:Protein of unknown function DUF262